ncbi:hypothetical protein OBBRIDRAFT_104443 [Obba rivulosa]|uniref:Elongin-A n=1 Tax=Obba rivulosa TaxID=1052685 RepID=A0A8E2APW7_9APHY|nr:hypothetical protein OBBRIDRAFT_104443 [Obba rivulosa]
MQLHPPLLIMPGDVDNPDQPTRPVPSLVQYCQRVLAANADSISSLGDGLRYDLIRPVLEACSADTLLRLEQASPLLEEQTSEIWKNLCMRTYPILAHQYLTNLIEEPDSWRDQYFIQRDLEAQRLEVLGTRLRTQRAEAEERKRESSIKITDRLPPVKRSRGWGTTPPKSLLQKTRSEAARMQKGIYGMRVLPMPKAKDYTRTASSTQPLLPPPPSPATSALSSATSATPPSAVVGSRLTVTAVPVRRPPPAPAPKPPNASSTTKSAGHSKPSPAKPTPPAALRSSPPEPPTPPPTLVPRSPAAKPPATPAGAGAKRDKMSALFMPKHRAHSQLPAR